MHASSLQSQLHARCYYSQKTPGTEQDAPAATVILGADLEVESEGFKVSELTGSLEITQA